MLQQIIFVEMSRYMSNNLISFVHFFVHFDIHYLVCSLAYYVFFPYLVLNMDFLGKDVTIYCNTVGGQLKGHTMTYNWNYINFGSKGVYCLFNFVLNDSYFLMYFPLLLFFNRLFALL